MGWLAGRPAGQRHHHHPIMTRAEQDHHQITGRRRNRNRNSRRSNSCCSGNWWPKDSKRKEIFFHFKVIPCGSCRRTNWGRCVPEWVWQVDPYFVGAHDPIWEQALKLEIKRKDFFSTSLEKKIFIVKLNVPQFVANRTDFPSCAAILTCQ